MTEKILRFRRDAFRDRSDADLVDACRDGDRRAVDELFRRHAERVRGIVVRLRYVAREDLDDVLQTTFLEVFRSASAYTGRAAVGTWIVGVAMNVVRHYVRAEVRRRSVESSLAHLPLPSSPPGPDQKLSNQELFARLEREFESLPEDLRMVFTLCDLEEMRGMDVARALEVPEGTVWRRLHNARRRLRRAIEGEDG